MKYKIVESKLSLFNLRQVTSLPVIIFLSVVSIDGSSLLHCKSKAKQYKQEDTVNMSLKDTTIIIHGKYLISVPDNYIVSSGTGDDTEFIQIRDQSGNVTLGYEYGLNNIPEKNTASGIEKSYHKVDAVNTMEGQKLWVVYNRTKNKVRDRAGKIFIGDNGQVAEILSFSCSAAYLDKIIEITRSLRIKIN